MLCVIGIKVHHNDAKDVEYVFDVPDELFMYHMAMYGTLQPQQMSDREFQSCKLIGTRKSMKYIGPAETSTNNRKEKK